MTVKDPVKNREYVAIYCAMKKQNGGTQKRV
jgi:hypothetical protein